MLLITWHGQEKVYALGYDTIAQCGIANEGMSLFTLVQWLLSFYRAHPSDPLDGLRVEAVD